MVTECKLRNRKILLELIILHTDDEGGENQHNFKINSHVQLQNLLLEPQPQQTKSLING